MLYLLDGTEFEPEINYTGSAKSIHAKFNMSDIIYNKLKLASGSKELIHTQWLRGTGKTYELVQFAKVRGYAVIEPTNDNALKIILREKYNEVYSSKIESLRGCKKNGDAFIKDVVIDEGVTNIQEIKEAGFNIITGFYTPKKESEIPFSQRVKKTLMDEIDALTPKLQQTRENRDYGTYKNLINAYREVLNLLRDFKA